jgi:prepilin-type processing-associated H-X9-DG protein
MLSLYVSIQKANVAFFDGHVKPTPPAVLNDERLWKR